MATVFRPPLYVPKPPHEDPRQLYSRAAPLLAGLLTSQLLFGVGGQVADWMRRFDIGDDSIWQGTPVDSWVIPALTSGGQPKQPQRKFDWEETPLWQPAVQRNTGLLATLVVQNPLVTEPRKFDIGDDSIWQGSPVDSWVIPTLTAGGKPKQPQRKFDWEENPLWTPAVQRNTGLLATIVVQNPLTTAPRRFDIGDDGLWQGSPDASALLANLLTAGGKPKQPQRKFDIGDDSLWIGRPSSSALLATILTAGGQVHTKLRRFDWVDDPWWQRSPPYNYALNHQPAPRTQPFLNTWNYTQVQDDSWRPRWPNLALSKAAVPSALSVSLPAFQWNAFQWNAFQKQVAHVTSTYELQQPINAVLAGQQLYKESGTTFEALRGKAENKVQASGSNLFNIGGTEPTFTVTTNKRGYD